MTLDEAIKHAEEEAREQDKLCKRYDDASGYTRSHNEDIRSANAKKCAKCADNHRQLAEWLKELKQLREQTSWIPVSERLPEADADVLVTNGIVMYTGWIDPTDKGWRVDSASEYIMKDIIAWMPLPQPYKVEGSEGE